MNLVILGRQPALGLAELERVYGSKNVNPINNTSALICHDSIDIQKLGGILKSGRIIENISGKDWREVSDKIVRYYTNLWSAYKGKITLGLSVYSLPVSTRDIQKIGIIIKQRLKNSGASIRLIPNIDPALSTATSHHNKLGLSPNKFELIIVKTDSGDIIVAESTGSQNITAYANRDQARPKRDAFVGMLPPKLAQIMINLAVGNLLCTRAAGVTSQSDQKNDLAIKPVILDPFCGTGVILQEAALMGYSVYGTDLSEKMIRYSRDNLNWLADSHNVQFEWYLHEGDAMTAKWRQPINAVVCESYLGQPFSAPPSPTKLNEVVENCDHIITEFLRNLRDQIEPGTPICIAIPAWRNQTGQFTHLPIVGNVARYGYRPHEFTNVSQNSLMYYRSDQVVARELLVLTKV